MTLLSDGVELQMVCPRAPTLDEGLLRACQISKSHPVMLQLDLATGDFRHQAGEQSPSSYASMDTDFVFGGEAAKVVYKSDGSLSVRSGRAVSLAAASDGQMRLQFRFKPSSGGEPLLSFGVCRAPLETREVDVKSGYWCDQHAETAAVFEKREKHVHPDPRFTLQPGDIVEVVLDIGDGSGPASLSVGCQRFPLRCLTRSLTREDGTKWHFIIGSRSPTGCRVEVLGIQRRPHKREHEVVGQPVAQRCDAAAFDPASGLAYAADAVTGAIRVLAPPDLAARDPMNVVGRLHEILNR